MQINIQGHGIELTPPLRDYTLKKVGKIEEFFKNIQKAQVVLDARCDDDSKRSQVAEVTVWMAGKKVIRASEAGQDMYAAVDLVMAEIERQIKKQKEKNTHEKRREAEKLKQIYRSYTPPSAAKEAKLAKLKRFNITAMTSEEAKAEKQKLGHEFFLFRDAESGEINVIHDGGIEKLEDLSVYSEAEAIKKVMQQGSAFLAFKNKNTNELNVLYKRKSGNLGLIEPSL
jgi:putative sigma-54 modulation protein